MCAHIIDQNVLGFPVIATEERSFETSVPKLRTNDLFGKFGVRHQQKSCWWSNPWGWFLIAEKRVFSSPALFCTFSWQKRKFSKWWNEKHTISVDVYGLVYWQYFQLKNLALWCWSTIVYEKWSQGMGWFYEYLLKIEELKW